MAKKTESKGTRQRSPHATADLCARVLLDGLDNPIVDKRGKVGFAIKARLDHDPVNRVGLPCRPNERNVITFGQMKSVVRLLRRLLKKERPALQ